MAYDLTKAMNEGWNWQEEEARLGKPQLQSKADFYRQCSENDTQCPNCGEYGKFDRVGLTNNYRCRCGYTAVYREGA